MVESKIDPLPQLNSMISTFDYIQKYPWRCKQLLGIDYDQFTSLVNCAKKCHEEELLELESRKTRIYRLGGGRKEILSIPSQVCLCLFYLRQIPTFEVLGMLFGISKTSANDTFHYWRKILRKILPSSLLEQVSKNQSDLMIVTELLTDFKLLVDSTEQPINRPLDNDKQQDYYSGKTKQHSKKNQIIGMPLGKDIIDVEIGFPGKKSDINIYRKQKNKFNKKQEFSGDKAYQGGENITTPHKSRKNKKLSEQQKTENKILSSKRIFIEHLIRVIKIFQIAEQRFRLSSSVYEEIILLVCGLVRLRIGALILPT